MEFAFRFTGQWSFCQLILMLLIANISDFEHMIVGLRILETAGILTL